jgi:hypothetical protein
VTVTLYAVTLDCSDAARLADFWAGALKRPVDAGATEEFASIGLGDPPDRRPHWMFAKVSERKTVKNRVHPDLIAAELDNEVQRLVGLGAVVKTEFEESGFHWVTLLDPDRNEFDVVAQTV